MDNMDDPLPIKVSAAELQRNIGRYQDLALTRAFASPALTRSRISSHSNWANAASR